MVPREVKNLESENWRVVARGWGKGGMENSCLMETEFQFVKMKKFQRWMEVMVVQQCECTYCYCTVHVQMVEMISFMLRLF